MSYLFFLKNSDFVYNNSYAKFIFLFKIFNAMMFEILIFKYAKNKSIIILMTHYINYIVVSFMSFLDFLYGFYFF